MRKMIGLFVVIAAFVVAVTMFLKQENTQEFSVKKIEVKETVQQQTVKKRSPQELTQESNQKKNEPEEIPTADYELKRVASAYAAESVYPDYSIPIAGNEHLLERNKNFPVERNYNLNGGEGGIAVSMDKFRYESGETAEAEAVIQGAPAFISSIKSVYGMVGEEKISFTYMDGGDANFYTATINTSDLSGEQNMKFFVDTHGKEKLLQTVPFEVFSPIGEVTGVGSTKVEENNLIIPVKVSLDKAGFYRISGNLFLKESDKAITHLQGKKYIRSSGSNTIELKAYGKHFADENIEGDLILKDIELRRQPTKPGPDQKTEYGAPVEEAFEVDSVNPDMFSDKPYSDPMIKARVDFLNKLSE